MCCLISAKTSLFSSASTMENSMRSLGSEGADSDVPFSERRRGARGQLSRQNFDSARCDLRDGSRLFGLPSNGSFHTSGDIFRHRAKSNLQSCVRNRRSVDRTTGLRCDQSVLDLFEPRLSPTCCVEFVTPRPTTNTRSFSSPTTPHCRPHNCTDLQFSLQIELFFRFIKQHLWIRSFIGSSDNTVSIQI